MSSSQKLEFLTWKIVPNRFQLIGFFFIFIWYANHIYPSHIKEKKILKLLLLVFNSYAFVKYLYEFTIGHVARDLKLYIWWIFELMLTIDKICLSHFGEKKLSSFSCSHLLKFFEALPRNMLCLRRQGILSISLLDASNSNPIVFPLLLDSFVTDNSPG